MRDTAPQAANSQPTASQAIAKIAMIILSHNYSFLITLCTLADLASFMLSSLFLLYTSTDLAPSNSAVEEATLVN
jgi:hypothetical protein